MLPRAMCVLVVAVSCLLASGAWAAELVLAEGGKSDYQIVLADNASPSTRYGAEELQAFLAQMSGAKLPIVSDQKPMGPHEIILGDNAHLRELGANVDFKSLGAEGYVIRTVGQRLAIAGGPLRGNMYGVFGFLEDHLGCRWFAPGVSRIPKSARLAVGPIDDRQAPALEYREPLVEDCLDGDWCARNRMNSSNARLAEKHGGKLAFADGFFVHTFNRLVPPEMYFAKHPEYFSLVHGRRQKGRSQLCCTNPDVIRLCTEAIRQAMRRQPAATVFSVSQNDCFGYCECPVCQALAKREAAQIAPVLQLVNRVAEGVEKEFPDKIVETLAYEWSRRAPKSMRPRRNVVVRLCSIECCFSHPLETCDSKASRAFRADLAAWSQVAPRLWVWDYATDFKHYLLPFPNQRVRGPNIRFYAAQHVTGILEQDTYNTPQGELSELGGYITAKCLWNPNYDPRRAMDEFLEGYYGRAAAPIRAYIDLLHDRVESEHIHVDIRAECGSPYLPDELLLKANLLWRQAAGLVAAEPAMLRRVRLSRMSVDYAILERARLESPQRLPINAPLLALARQRFAPFFQTLQTSKITRLNEWKLLDKEAYRRKLALSLQIKL
jgi:hypothetical protein